jgi:hypothetical protein
VDFRRWLDALGAEHGGGVDSSLVASAEERIGVLPDDYRSFLTEVGWASLGADEVTGLGPDLPHRWQDVVELTRQERSDGGLPGSLVALHADGGGSFTCLDGQRVVFWAHDDPGSTTPVADSFSTWLVDLLGTP